MVTVRLTDGIHIEPETGPTVVADASAPPNDPTVCSHAHTDHLYSAQPGTLCCSETTAELAALRRSGLAPPDRSTHPDIELLPAGHIAGSRAAVIHAGNERILYTGDVSTRDRWHLDGFDPVPADVLIVESTYGRPAYRFPDQRTVESRAIDWLDHTIDRPAIVVGYSLGKAQKLQQLVADSSRERCIVPPAVARLNEAFERTMDVGFESIVYDENLTLGPGDAIVLPRSTLGASWVEQLGESTPPVTAGFSGWAANRSFRFRTGDDETFVLSDHCDFDELVDLVRAVDPDQVYTWHGFADDFARILCSEHGYPARSLKRGQRSLDEF